MLINIIQKILAIDAKPYLPTPFNAPPTLHCIQSNKNAKQNTIIEKFDNYLTS